MPEAIFGFDASAVGVGLVFVFVALLTAIGKVFGKKDREKPGPQMELAGAIIDNRKANALIDAFDRLAKAMDENSAASRDTARGMPAIHAEIVALRQIVAAFGDRNEDGVDELNRRLEQIKDHLIMNAPRGR